MYFRFFVLHHIFNVLQILCIASHFLCTSYSLYCITFCVFTQLQLNSMYFKFFEQPQIVFDSLPSRQFQFCEYSISLPLPTTLPQPPTRERRNLKQNSGKPRLLPNLPACDFLNILSLYFSISIRKVRELFAILKNYQKNFTVLTLSRRYFILMTLSFQIIYISVCFA